MNKPIPRAIAKGQLERINEALFEPHILIGGLAVQQFHTARDSQDIDLVCDFATAQRLLDALYPTLDWDIKDEKDNEYRPSYRITHKVDNLGTIIFGPKISERAPYDYIDWELLKKDAVPFKLEGTTLKNILVPAAYALAYTKFISFLGRQSPLGKVEADLRDFVNLTNDHRFSASLFYGLLRKAGSFDPMMHAFRDKCAAHLKIVETSCLYHMSAMFVAPARPQSATKLAAVPTAPTPITSESTSASPTGAASSSASTSAASTATVVGGSTPVTEPPSPEIAPGPAEETPKREESQESRLAVFGEYFAAMNEGRLKEGSALFEQILSTFDDEVARAAWRVGHLELSYRATGRSEFLRELEESSKNGAGRDHALAMLAEISLMGHDYREAIAKYRAAAELSDNFQAAANWIIEASKIHHQIGEVAEARRVLIDSMGLKTDADWRVRLLVALANTYESTSDAGIKGALLMKAVQLAPVNKNVRFDSAYALAQASLARVAFMLYDTLLRIEPKHAGALNNLGLLCDELEMPFQAATLLRRSQEAGSALAATNLAHKFIAAGFLDKAEELISVARKDESVHENVSSALSRLANKKKAEEETWQSTIKLAMREHVFLSDFCNALLLPDAVNSFLGPWELPSGKLAQFKPAGGQFTAVIGDKDRGQRLSLRPMGRAATISSAEWVEYARRYDTSRSGYAYLHPRGGELRILWFEGTQSSEVTWRSEVTADAAATNDAQQAVAADEPDSLAPLGGPARG